MNPQLSSNRKLLNELLRYSFSTKYQFMELCARNGFSVQRKEDNIICRKGGESVILSNNLIEFCSERYRKQIDLKQKRKIQSLIYKYAAKLSKDKFSEYMKSKFGLEFIFYGKKDDINGYTIIDYKNHCVYKGSDIFGAKKISELFEEPKTISDFEFLLQETLDSNPLCDYNELKSILQESYYYTVKGNKVIEYNSEEVYELNDTIMQKLQYNRDVKVWAETFKPYNNELARIVASIVHVQPSDMQKMAHYEKPSSDVIEHFNKVLMTGLNSECNLREYLERNHICMIVSNEKFYLLDYISRVSISSDDLHIKVNEVLDKVRQDNEFERNRNYNEDNELSGLGQILEQALSIVDFSGLFFTGSVGGAKNNKKRRKRSS